MKRQVALIIETSSIYGRNLLSGIVRYMRMHDEWSVYLEQRDLWKQPPTWLNNWPGDGIITRTTTPELLESTKRTGVSLVEVNDRRGESELIQVRSNDAAVGEMGAGHLMDRGFERFAYCGFTGEAWSMRRQEAFEKTVATRPGATCEVFNSVWHGEGAQTWVEERQAIAEWLQQLTLPIAIMACSDVRAQHVIEACSQQGIAVPEQAAVLGVDNDDLLCRLCSPPLSSVIPNAELVGFRAAQELDRLMNNRPPEHDGNVQEINPLGVATRHSTDVVAIEDRGIAAALQYIREHACRGLTVDEVVKQNSVSRSTLERQVRKHLGRTPQEEIRHVQIKRVRELLLATDLPAEGIAGLCGFDHPEYMHVVFKRIAGMTPGEFRRQAKP
ncbi:MAG: DNA-binding transcriptional regulator [Planctomycetaceae bacterium]|nr:DNA-binding transcriptional regulator [Planctomycetaceae bacterium]